MTLEDLSKDLQVLDDTAKSALRREVHRQSDSLDEEWMLLDMMGLQ